jgi:NADH:ubiquinone oxidoreductase subunit
LTITQGSGRVEAMAKIGTLLSNWLYGKLVGADQFGNKYYVTKGKNALGKNKRSVIYKGMNEPSKVPPMWHQWLHYLIDAIPNNEKSHAWEQAYVPNVTGTKFAYHNHEHNEWGKKTNPLGEIIYQPWEPK